MHQQKQHQQHQQHQQKQRQQLPAASQVVEVKVPNIDTTDAEIIDVLVSEGESIEEDASVITVETDKASMDVPSAVAGVVKSVEVKVGDKVSEGHVMLLVEVAGAAPRSSSASSSSASTSSSASSSQHQQQLQHQRQHQHQLNQLHKAQSHASPSVRRTASEFGVNLTEVGGTGRKGRIVKEDVQTYVKSMIARAKSGGGAATGNFSVMDAPKVDFAKFGEVEEVALSRIQKISGPIYTATG